MTDDDFIAALQANPADDALRLIYADWLEERGDARAEFLRIDVELSHPGMTEPRNPRLLERLFALGDAIDPVWLGGIGKRFDLVLVSYEFGRKIESVKAYRFATGDGLKEAKHLFGCAPQPVRRSMLRCEAERMKQKFYSATCIRVNKEYPFDPSWATLEIRPVISWND